MLDASFNTVGSVSLQAKKLMLLKKWDYKKQNNLRKDEDPMITKMREDLENSEKAAKTERIKHKLLLGKKLSAEDMDWLREHAPDLYDKAKQVAREREHYKSELRRCRTKEDVERLERRMALSLTSTADKKDPEFAVMRLAGCHDEYKEYKGTSDYQILKERRQHRKNEDSFY
jgi:hypothetical protein